MSASGLFLTIFVPMVLEARLAARHERALRARGALEPSGDVYPIMRVAYPLCFLAMLAEAWIRRAGSDWLFSLGLALFLTAKALKYWAIATLGDRWTFRILVPPGSTCMVSGPYRYLRHPNYVAVVGELVGMALVAHAPITGVAATVGFCLLMRARIRVEERALAESSE